MVSKDGNNSNVVSRNASQKNGSRVSSAALSGNRPGLYEKYKPGTNLTVGIRKVEIVKYLTEGGFAQIYVAKFIEYLNEFDNNDNTEIEKDKSDNNKNTQNRNLKIGDTVCLKRVIVPNEKGLNEMRNEVEVMKKLVNCPNIVQYYDSNASKIRDYKNNNNSNNESNNSNPEMDSGFEVLLLMEYCPNKSLLDFMNQRLATKLNENEILKIMTDVTTAVLQMHYLDLPLIHRDIKIENVLVDSNNNFKLADFGSTTRTFPPVTTHQEIALLNQDIYMNTTPQYRSPEMIDLYKCLPIDEKSDIWALGVLLYKLLFYTTPFETTGQFAILHSKYEFPMNNYSSKYINLIIIMLSENPNLRPNIYQVLHYLKTISNSTESSDNIATMIEYTDKYGQGPYNFEVYTKFQSNLTSLNNTMSGIQLRKFENDGKLNMNDSLLLNKIYDSTFEISPKLPLDSSTNPLGSNNASNIETNMSNDNYIEKKLSSVSDEKRGISTSSFSNISGVNMEKTLSSALNNANNVYLPVTSQRQKSQSSFSSNGAKSTKSIPKSDLPPDDYLINEKTSKSDIMKQHKSNNPFPQLKQSNNNIGNNNSNHANNGTHQMFIDTNFLANNINNSNNVTSPMMPITQGNMNINTIQPPPPQQPIQHLSPQFNHSQPYGFNDPFKLNSLEQQQNQNITANKLDKLPVSQMVGNFNFTSNSQSFYPPAPVGTPIPSTNNKNAVEASLKTSDLKRQSGVAPPVPPHPRNNRIKNNDASNSKDDRQKNSITEKENILLADSAQRCLQKKDIRNRQKEHSLGLEGNDNTFLPTRDNIRTDLDLTLNELDLNGETNSTNTPMSEVANDGLSDSILSSESIDINLDEARQKTKNAFKNARNANTESHDKYQPNEKHHSTTEKYYSHQKMKELNHINNHRGKSNHATSNQPVVTEQKAGRRSLDLKYQEVHFSSPDLSSSSRKKNIKNSHFPIYEGHPKSENSSFDEDTPSGSQSSSSHHHQTNVNHNTHHSSKSSRAYNSQPHSSSNNTGLTRSTTRANHDLEHYKERSKKQGDSSISLGDVRDSFSRARQSLDLERMRRDNYQKGSEGSTKRRSFFSSVFSKK